MASSKLHSSSESSVNKTPDGRIIYKLKVPLVQGDHVVNELHFRQPKLKHMKEMDGAKGNFDMMARTIETLCDIRTGLVGEIDAQDFEGIGKIIADFFPQAQSQ